MSASQEQSQEQTLSGRGARVDTAHRGWLGVVTGISAASTGGVLVTLMVQVEQYVRCVSICLCVN